MLTFLIALAHVAPNVAVMIHGAGGGGWEYDFWKPVFEKAGWTVIARDLVPAKGGLAKTTIEDYTAQVRSWIPAQHRKLVLIGASMGGPLALRVAEGSKPNAVVLVNPVPIAELRLTRAKQTFPPVIHWANGPWKDTVDSMPDSDLATQKWAFKRWRDESGKAMTALRAGLSVKKPTCPVLVIIGMADTDVAPASSEKMAKWAGAEVFRYMKTSHVGPLMGRRASRIARDAIHWMIGATR